MSSLPQSIVDMASMFGYEATMQFVQVFGGRTIRSMPGGTKGGVVNDAIEEIFGAQAKRFMAYYAHTQLYVPRCRSELVNARNRAIQLDFDGGMTIDKLVIKYGICDRAVSKVLKRVIPDSVVPPRHDDGQLDMFNTTNG